MKIFNVKEIIEYAIQIEKESFVFYTNTAKLIEDADVKALLEKLSGEFGVSRERIRQIEVRAFEKVQKAVQKAAAAVALPEPEPVD